MLLLASQLLATFIDTDEDDVESLDASQLLQPNSDLTLELLYGPIGRDSSAITFRYPVITALPSVVALQRQLLIQPLSDTHIEYSGGQVLFRPGSDACEKFLPLPPPEAKERGVLILAGDIGSPWLRPEVESPDECGSLTAMFEWASEKYAHVCFVAGNHEFCGGVVSEGKEEMAKLCEPLANVHFLDRGQVNIDHVRIIGCTLWSEVPDFAIEAVGDRRTGLIEYTDRGAFFAAEERLRPEHTNVYHQEDLAFLRARLTQFREEKERNPEVRVVVVSHHSPLPSGVCPGKYEVSENLRYFAFVADLRAFLVEFADVIDMWVFGHTHWSVGWRAAVGEHEVAVVSNQVGYFARPERNDVTGFQRGLVFSL